MTETLQAGARGTVFIVFGGEIGAMLLDMRWAVALLLLLLIADFHFGWSESRKRYEKAKRQRDAAAMERYRWHRSRALRNTGNKLADYVVLMLVLGGVGMAIFEPVGISHTWGAWAGAVLACYCELSSIAGHFFYLRGVEVKKKTLVGFIKGFVVAFAKKKDADVGEAVEEALKKQETDKSEER